MHIATISTFLMGGLMMAGLPDEMYIQMVKGRKYSGKYLHGMKIRYVRAKIYTNFM